MSVWSAFATPHEKFLRTGNISYLYTMERFDVIVVSIYFLILAILSFYGLHRYIMVFLYRRHHRNPPQAAAKFAELPRVTVQIPIYNEMYVAERVIDAVCAFDYPRDRLDIQVL